GGKPVVTILDLATGAFEREIPIADVDQIFNPTWSPDGQRIAFSALHKGFSDLYILDLASSSTTPLTSDRYADLQPSWSPDGHTIAFATDRFSSSIATLTFGGVRLGLIDVASHDITEAPSVPAAKNIDPHWSADGRTLYFIADVGGVNNVYRASLADHVVTRVTDVATGVSGISALSPALT